MNKEIKPSQAAAAGFGLVVLSVLARAGIDPGPYSFTATIINILDIVGVLFLLVALGFYLYELSNK